MIPDNNQITFLAFQNSSQITIYRLGTNFRESFKTYDIGNFFMYNFEAENMQGKTEDRPDDLAQNPLADPAHDFVRFVSR